MRRSRSRGFPGLGLLAAVLAIGPVTVAVAGEDDEGANMVFNGDFELSVPARGTGNGWTSSGAGVFWSATGGNPAGNFVLNESGQLASDPIVEQTVAGFAIGRTYRIEGERRSYAPNFGNPAALAFAVLLDDEPILELDRGVTATVWEAFAVEFVASEPIHTVGFVAERNGDDSSYRIDNVAVRPVPEPGAPALGATGLAAVVALGRTRRG
jgi:hypothetical protein